MNNAEIKKLKKIFAELEPLNAEIIAMQKIARKVADGKTGAALSLTIQDLSQPQVKPPVLDEDGSLIQPTKEGRSPIEWMNAPPEAMFFLPHPYRSMRDVLIKTQQDSSKKTKSTFEVALSDVLTLHVMELIMQEKQMRRQVLVAELLTLGIKL